MNESISKFAYLYPDDIEIVELALNGYKPQSFRYRDLCRKLVDRGALQESEGGVFFATDRARHEMAVCDAAANEVDKEPEPPAKTRHRGRQTLDRFEMIQRIVQQGLPIVQTVAPAAPGFIDLCADVHLYVKPLGVPGDAKPAGKRRKRKADHA